MDWDRGASSPLLPGTTQSSASTPAPVAGVAGSVQQLSQSALINRSLSCAGRGWPSLAQNDCAWTRGAIASKAAAQSSKLNLKGELEALNAFIGSFYNEGCSQKSFRHPHFYKILIRSN